MRTYYVAKQDYTMLTARAGTQLSVYRNPDELRFTPENYAALQKNLALVDNNLPCFYATVKINSSDIINKLNQAAVPRHPPENSRLHKKLVSLFERACKELLENILLTGGQAPEDNHVHFTRYVQQILQKLYKTVEKEPLLITDDGDIEFIKTLQEKYITARPSAEQLSACQDYIRDTDLQDYFSEAMDDWNALQRRTEVIAGALTMAEIYNDYLLHFEQLREIIGTMPAPERANWFAVAPANREVLPSPEILSCELRAPAVKNLINPAQLTASEIALLLQRYDALRCQPPRPRDEYYIINEATKIKILSGAE